MADHRPLYFFWDYDIDEDQVRAILRGKNTTEKIWAMSRILQYARWDDIWHYLSLKDVQENFEQLHWRTPALKELWAHALKVWSRGSQ